MAVGPAIIIIILVVAIRYNTLANVHQPVSGSQLPFGNGSGCDCPIGTSSASMVPTSGGPFKSSSPLIRIILLLLWSV